MKLKAYCMDWHLHKSDAFRDLLQTPFEGCLEIELVDIAKWRPAQAGQPQIFCQVHPPPELLTNKSAKVVWIPMWDNVHGFSQDDWDALPKHWRVVCLADAIYHRVKRAGLPALRLTYYKDPGLFEPVQWHRRVIFYWNRIGLVGPDFLRQLCSNLTAQKLIFRPDIDPGIDKSIYYELPDRLGHAAVEVIHETTRNKHLELIKESNLYIAPRLAEGIGMTFLEAMARGCAVLAYDAPTMNEYIHHKHNGYLFNTQPSRQPVKRSWRLAKKLVGQPSQLFVLSPDQAWREVVDLNWAEIGRRARQDHVAGYAKWQKSLSGFAEFLTSW